MLVWSALMRKFVVLIFVLVLSACSSTDDRKGVYEKQVENASSLEVPPDLVMPENNKALDIPSIGASQMTYTEFSDSRAQQQNSGDVLATVTNDMRVVRDGSVQWLEVKATPNVIWPQLQAYFRSEGFEIKVSDTRIGFFETEWKENRVGIPTNWLSKLLKKLYDSGLMDRYRVRVEKADEEITRVFITHQGLKEVSSDEVGSDLEGILHSTYWEVRESDPELEAEMMQRFLVYRGAGEDTSRAMVKAAKFKERALLKDDSDFAYLEINENFPRSWRHMGIALDRIGLLVEDRNRSAGIYYVKLTDEYWKTHERKDSGWFGGLFSSSKGSKEAAYILKIASQGETTRVTILNRDSSNATDPGARDLLVQLQRYLR